MRKLGEMMKNESGGAPRTGSASKLIDERIASLGDWRGQMLARLRTLIKKADPHVVEEWKWEVPVWSHDGIVCTGESYKSAVKLTFAKGASVDDPVGLFNSSLGGGTRRAIDFREGEKVNEKAFVTLIRAAVAVNSKAGGSRPAAKRAPAKAVAPRTKAAPKKKAAPQKRAATK
jgi:hypothetical protein